MDVLKDSQRGLNQRSCVVEVCVSGRVSESHVRKLCEIVPGMLEYKCDAQSGRCTQYWVAYWFNERRMPARLVYVVALKDSAYERLVMMLIGVAGIAIVTYSSPACATYAMEKLHGFEYPVGCPLSVKLQAPTGCQCSA